MNKQQAIALAKEMEGPTLPGTGIILNVPSNWDWGEKVLSKTRSVLQIKTSYGAAAHFLINVADPKNIDVQMWDQLLFEAQGGEYHLDFVLTILSNYIERFVDWSREQSPLIADPNTLGGFGGAFYVTHKRAPTNQEIFDAGVRSGMQRPRKSPLGPQLAYFASPFSHPDKAHQEWNRRQACKAAGALIILGTHVVSPIAHNLAVINEMQGLETGWELWRDQDLAMLRKCDKLIVYKLPGWDTSVGVTEEIKTATELGMPIEYIETEERYELESHTAA
jgi:hypothetical protein